MGFMTEFKEFASKGNVVDLAVGVIIGGAFGKIVGSLVDDVIMPIVSKIFGGLDFSNYFIPLAGQTVTVQPRSGRSKWPSVCRPATSLAPVEYRKLPPKARSSVPLKSALS